MKEIINKILSSFDNSSEGFSARKLTAFSLMVCIAYVHYKYVNESTAIEALITDLCGVLIALGIVTAEQIINLKNGSKNNEPN